VIRAIILTMIKREEDGAWLELEETIAAHHEDVFACFTTVGGLTRWYPVAAEVELRNGGTIKLCWDEKCTRTLTVKILDYDPGGYIVWEWFANRGDLRIPIRWTVEPSVEDGAKVKLRQGSFPEEPDALIALAEEATSWRWQLCNLRTALEAKHDMRKVRPL
jgi:uncharacterized protein YndB with AHSA1/START domain